MATSTIQGGPLPINRGGTGKTTAADARTALGIKVYSRSQFSMSAHRVLTNGTIEAGKTLSGSESVTKVGYYPLGIVGWSTGGDGSSYAVTVRCYLTKQENGSCTVNYYLRNVGSGKIDATLNVSYYILWALV